VHWPPARSQNPNLANATAIGVLESPEAAKTLNLMNLVLDPLIQKYTAMEVNREVPIKWAGGKTRVMPQLLKHLPKADCLMSHLLAAAPYL
jgi:hypothetical protein